MSTFQVGVVDIKPQDIEKKGRLMPGNIFLVDFDEGQVVDDVALKAKYASQFPYGEWLNDEQLHIDDFVKAAFKKDLLPPPIGTSISLAKGNGNGNSTSLMGQITCTTEEVHSYLEDIVEPLTAFGYTREAIELLVMPMTSGAEPLGSMGNDAALAHISKCAKQPYEYFKQLFAQVWSLHPCSTPFPRSAIQSLLCPTC